MKKKEFNRGSGFQDNQEREYLTIKKRIFLFQLQDISFLFSRI